MVYDFAMDDGMSAAVKRPKLHYPRNKRHEGIVAIDFAVDAPYVNAPDMHGVTRLRPQ
jgi:hypothetical protein